MAKWWTGVSKQSIISRMAQCPAAPLEVEAKLLVPHAGILSAIARLRHIGPYQLRPRRPASLYTLYLDTSDFTLAQHEIALRLRRSGARWEATLKWGGTEQGILHARPERTVRLSRQPVFPYILPAALRSADLLELVKDAPLQPIVVSDVYRRRFTISLPEHNKSRTCAELALDWVRLYPPHARRQPLATYGEVEIELEPGGTVQEVRQVATLLQERFALTPARGSKFSRGLELLYGWRQGRRDTGRSSTELLSGER